MHSSLPPPPLEGDRSWRIALIASSFHAEQVDQMMKSAQQYLTMAGISPKNISVHRAAGAFEIPLIGAALAESKKADALIGLGVIVEGDTHHAELLARETARGIMNVQVQEKIPFAFEVLYVDNLALAAARSSKGGEAAAAVLHSLATLGRIRS